MPPTPFSIKTYPPSICQISRSLSVPMKRLFKLVRAFFSGTKKVKKKDARGPRDGGHKAEADPETHPLLPISKDDPVYPPHPSAVENTPPNQQNIEAGLNRNQDMSRPGKLA